MAPPYTTQRSTIHPNTKREMGFLKLKRMKPRYIRPAEKKYTPPCTSLSSSCTIKRGTSLPGIRLKYKIKIPQTNAGVKYKRRKNNVPLGSNGLLICVRAKQIINLRWIAHFNFDHPSFTVRILVYQLRLFFNTCVELNNLSC